MELRERRTLALECSCHRAESPPLVERDSHASSIQSVVRKERNAVARACEALELATRVAEPGQSQLLLYKPWPLRTLNLAVSRSYSPCHLAILACLQHVFASPPSCPLRFFIFSPHLSFSLRIFPFLGAASGLTCLSLLRLHPPALHSRFRSNSSAPSPCTFARLPPLYLHVATGIMLKGTCSFETSVPR